MLAFWPDGIWQSLFRIITIFIQFTGPLFLLIFIYTRMIMVLKFIFAKSLWKKIILLRKKTPAKYNCALVNITIKVIAWNTSFVAQR